MARCQRYKLLAPAGEERIGGDDDRAGLQLDQGRERGLDLSFGASLQNPEPYALCAGRFLHLSNDALGQSDCSGLRA